MHAEKINKKNTRRASGNEGTAEAHLDQVLSFGLRDERLEFRCREGVDESGFGDYEQKHLSSSENRQLVRLLGGGSRHASVHRTLTRMPTAQARQPTNGMPSSRLVTIGRRRTFFMMPAFLFENVMWRRDLSWMNLISIFLRSRPGFESSSSSSSSPVLGRGRLRELSAAEPETPD